jgi:hypothetical protein
MTKIKNINGNAANKTVCKCGSWLEHWENYGGGRAPAFCIVSSPNCLERAELVGAHVQKVNDSTWYIAPLCAKHAAVKNTELTIDDTWPLITANVTKTCNLKKDLEPNDKY